MVDVGIVSVVAEVGFVTVLDLDVALLETDGIEMAAALPRFGPVHVPLCVSSLDRLCDLECSI